jgi:predicted unusual protein kinase regulating ubiquinone biosynthesis (AarF/ABC1/UbiB family)
VARDPEAIPTTKAVRATQATTALAPSTVRFFGTLATNLARSPEDAHQLLLRRHEEIADHALDALGQLRGGAMKLGQLASFVDVDFLPAEYREVYQSKLAGLRDAAPPMSFEKVRQVLEREWEEPVESLFAEFEPQAVAAASIGQVHRAVLSDGRQVAVKVQYPEIADALAADLGLASIGIRLAKAIAPGLDPEIVAGELRERVMEELDYELEAQHQRAFARAYRGHPFIYVPQVLTSLSRRRVMVSEWVDGVSFEDTLGLPQDERNRIGEILQRFFLGSMHRIGRFNTDPHPGNYRVRHDGTVAFFDFGNTKVVDPAWLAQTRRMLEAILRGDTEGYLEEALGLGYLRRTDRIDADWLLAQTYATEEWWLRDQTLTIDPDYVARMLALLMEVSPQAIRFLREAKLPPEEIWWRRVMVGVFAVLGQLRASANWHRIMREYVFEEPPSTELGRQDAEFWRARRPA